MRASEALDETQRALVVLYLELAEKLRTEVKPHLPPMPLLVTGEVLLSVTLEEKEGKKTTESNYTL